MLSLLLLLHRAREGGVCDEYSLVVWACAITVASDDSELQKAANSAFSLGYISSLTGGSEANEDLRIRIRLIVR